MLDVMPAVILHPTVNKAGRSDVTGAFMPKAHAFRRLHRLPAASVVPFDNTQDLGGRRSEVERAIRSRANIRTIAAFCHGWRDGIQFGVTMVTARPFAELLARYASPEGLRVVLYACDAGRDGDQDRSDDKGPGPGGEGGFADHLRDELVRLKLNVTVYAHATEGHTTANPYVRVFGPKDPEAGGSWLIEPRSTYWAPWTHALAESDLWARYPFMAREDVLAELRGLRA